MMQGRGDIEVAQDVARSLLCLFVSAMFGQVLGEFEGQIGKVAHATVAGHQKFNRVIESGGGLFEEIGHGGARSQKRILPD